MTIVQPIHRGRDGGQQVTWQGAYSLASIVTYQGWFSSLEIDFPFLTPGPGLLLLLYPPLSHFCL